MNELIFGLSVLVLIYGSIAVIVMTIRAAMRARKQNPTTETMRNRPVSVADESGEEPYYQLLCHHSHPIHLTK